MAVFDYSDTFATTLRKKKSGETAADTQKSMKRAKNPLGNGFRVDGPKTEKPKNGHLPGRLMIFAFPKSAR